MRRGMTLSAAPESTVTPRVILSRRVPILLAGVGLLCLSGCPATSTGRSEEKLGVQKLPGFSRPQSGVVPGLDVSKVGVQILPGFSRPQSGVVPGLDVSLLLLLSSLSLSLLA